MGRIATAFLFCRSRYKRAVTCATPELFLKCLITGLFLFIMARRERDLPTTNVPRDSLVKVVEKGKKTSTKNFQEQFLVQSFAK